MEQVLLKKFEQSAEADAWNFWSAPLQSCTRYFLNSRKRFVVYLRRVPL